MATKKVSGGGSKKSRTNSKSKPAAEAPKAAASESPKASKSAVGTIRAFDTIPAAVSTRVYEQSYKFGDVPVGQALFVEVGGSTKEEKEANAKKIRSNMFAALYRYQRRDSSAKNWNTAIRIVNDDKGIPKEVGFYRDKGTKKSAESTEAK